MAEVFFFWSLSVFEQRGFWEFGPMQGKCCNCSGGCNVGENIPGAHPSRTAQSHVTSYADYNLLTRCSTDHHDRAVGPGSWVQPTAEVSLNTQKPHFAEKGNPHPRATYVRPRLRTPHMRVFCTATTISLPGRVDHVLATHAVPHLPDLDRLPFLRIREPFVDPPDVIGYPRNSSSDSPRVSERRCV
jgi:hypothetical protein